MTSIPDDFGSLINRERHLVLKKSYYKTADDLLSFFIDEIQPVICTGFTDIYKKDATQILVSRYPDATFRAGPKMTAHSFDKSPEKPTSSVQTWDKHGNLISKTEYKDGLRDGESFDYYVDPISIRVLSVYKAGKLTSRIEFDREGYISASFKYDESRELYNGTIFDKNGCVTPGNVPHEYTDILERELYHDI